MKKTYKYLELIILLDVAMMMIVNVVSGKIAQLFIFTASVSVLMYPVTYLFGDVLTEVYGYKQARRAVWLLLLSQILSGIVYYIITRLPPAPGFKGNEAYTLVLGQVSLTVVGGLIAQWSGQFVNDFAIAKMKLFTKGKYLWTRTIGSTIAGQFVDTALFYSIALSSVIPSGLLLKAILSGWFLKVAVETLMTPVTYFIIRKLKKLENEDYFDRKTNFNPLIIDLTHNN